MAHHFFHRTLKGVQGDLWVNKGCRGTRWDEEGEGGGMKRGETNFQVFRMI